MSAQARKNTRREKSEESRPAEGLASGKGWYWREKEGWREEKKEDHQRNRVTVRVKVRDNSRPYISFITTW